MLDITDPASCPTHFRAVASTRRRGCFGWEALDARDFLERKHRRLTMNSLSLLACVLLLSTGKIDVAINKLKEGSKVFVLFRPLIAIYVISSLPQFSALLVKATFS